MEKHHKRHITNNLWELVLLTSVNTTCILVLTEKGVLSVEDVAELDAIPNELTKTRKLYQLLFTKKGSYPHLITALEKGLQSGALEILNKLGEEPCVGESSGATPPPKRRKTERGEKDPIRFDVLAPVLNFTGREPQLEELHQKLQETPEKRAVISQTASIVGLGGIGKTELARKYIEEYGEEFYDGNVIWISAQTEEALAASFRRLASDHLNWSLTTEDKREVDITTIVDRIYCLFNEQRVLFIFDNAESTDHLKKFMPVRLSSSTSSPYVLITSRDREWTLGVPVLELDEMTEKDAICFVKTSLSINDDDDWDEDGVLRLVNRLQRFPLALSQAVSFIKQRQFLGNFSISQYLERFEDNCEKLLDSKKPPAEFNAYRETTLSTWRVTTQQISSDVENGRCAMEILNSISYFLPDKIPMSIFPSVEYEEGLLLLVKYSMVNVQREEKSLSVHRLVQEVTRIQLKNNKEEEPALKIALQLLSSSLGEGLVYHVLSAYKFSCALTPNVSTEFKSLPWNVVEVLNTNVRYREAETVGKELAELLRHLVPEGEADLCRLEYRLAVSAYHLQENVVGGYLVLENVLPHFFDNKESSFSQLETLAVERLMTTYFQKLELYEDALDFSRYTFERQKTLYGLDEWHTIDALINLANATWSWKLYLTPDDLDEEGMCLAAESRRAELSTTLSVLEEAFSTRLELVGVDLNWTSTMVNMAKCFAELGETDSSNKIIREVIHRGAESCEKGILQCVISCFNFLITIKEIEGKPEVLILYQNLHSRLVDLKGESDPETLAAEANLCMKHWEMGESEAALEGCKHMQNILENAQLYHEQDLMIRLVIAEIFRKMGRLKESVELLGRKKIAAPMPLHSILETTKTLITRFEQLGLGNSEGDT